MKAEEIFKGEWMRADDKLLKVLHKDGTTFLITAGIVSEGNDTLNVEIESIEEMGLEQ